METRKVTEEQVLDTTVNGLNTFMENFKFDCILTLDTKKIADYINDGSNLGRIQMEFEQHEDMNELLVRIHLKDADGIPLVGTAMIKRKHKICPHCKEKLYEGRDI